MEQYNREINYIGSSPKMKKYTKHIHKRCGRINLISFLHDGIYSYILQVENVWLFFILKMLADLMFLIAGIFLNLLRWNLFRGVQEIIIIILAYMAIFVYTPVYITKHFYKTKKVRFY